MDINDIKHLDELAWHAIDELQRAIKKMKEIKDHFNAGLKVYTIESIDVEKLKTAIEDIDSIRKYLKVIGETNG